MLAFVPKRRIDTIMANPPFNLKDWRGPDTAMRGSANLNPEGTPQVTSEARNKLVHDSRWNGYETPPNGPASRGTNYTKGEGEIRQKLVENDLVDCMIALPGQLQTKEIESMKKEVTA